jgi:hypothetical protein
MTRGWTLSTDDDWGVIASEIDDIIDLYHHRDKRASVERRHIQDIAVSVIKLIQTVHSSKEKVIE